MASLGKRVFVGLETGPPPDEVLIEFEGRPRRENGDPSPWEVDRLVLVPTGDLFRAVFVPAVQAAQDADPVGRAELEFGRSIWWPIHRSSPVPASKLTFASWDPERLQSVMDETAFAPSAHPSFAGFAIHHPEAWRRLERDR